MAKQVIANIKLQIEAGKAKPSPPVGPALGQHGVNIMDFCKAFNAQTESMPDMLYPVVITVYQDKSFSFQIKRPPVAKLILRELGVAKGSGEPNKNKLEKKLTMQQVEEIAKTKMPDLNTLSLASAVKIVMGTARSMGVEINSENEQ